MQIYTFYVRLLIKKLLSFSIGQLNIIMYCIYSYFTISLPFSEAYIQTRNTKGNIKVPYIFSLKVLKFRP